MFKKIASIILTLTLILSFAGCVQINIETTDDSSINTAQSTSAPENNTTEDDAVEEIGDITVDPYKDAIVITPEELFSAYDSNEVAADNNYKGKTLKITGTIKDIGKDILDDVYITLDCGDFIFSIQCYFKNDQIDAVAQLAKDTTITVVGTCKGESVNILIEDCVIID